MAEMKYKVGDEVYAVNWAPATLGQGIIEEIRDGERGPEYVIYWSGLNSSGGGWKDKHLKSSR